MGEWKAPLSLRVRPAVRMEMEQYAQQQGRTVCGMGTALLEWAFEQMKIVGSTDRLLEMTLNGKNDPRGLLAPVRANARVAKKVVR